MKDSKKSDTDLKIAEPLLPGIKSTDRHFDRRWEDIADEEFEVSGDYSAEDLARKLLI